MINNTLTKSRSFSIVVLSLIVSALFSISEALEFEEIGNCRIPWSLEGAIWVDGDYAYLCGGGTFDLAIVDISDPSQPTLISTLDSLYNVEDVSVSGNYAYLAWSVGGLAVVDVADPAEPVMVAVVQTRQYAHNLFVSDSLVYLANCTRGLRIYDISDPLNPDSLGKFDSLYADEANGIVVIGNFAYLTEWYGGLWIVDISNPLAPVFVGNYPTRNVRTRDVRVSGNYAYLLSDIFSAITVVDISIPSDPYFARTFHLDGNARHLAMQGDFLLAAHDSVTVFDLSQAPDIVEVAAYGRQGSHGFEDVAISGDLIYTLSDTTLTILRLAPTSIEESRITAPEDPALSCYPNPFNTSVVMTLGGASDRGIEIFDISGREIARLQTAGGKAVWKASGLSSGIYFVRAESDGSSRAVRLTLLR
jgi:hypothetical protein